MGQGGLGGVIYIAMCWWRLVSGNMEIFPPSPPLSAQALHMMDYFNPRIVTINKQDLKTQLLSVQVKDFFLVPWD